MPAANEVPDKISKQADKVLHKIKLFQCIAAVAALAIAFSFILLVPHINSGSSNVIAMSAGMIIGALVLILTSVTQLIIAPLRGIWEQTESISRDNSFFLTRMCHEIRNPMNAITGFCELADRENNTPVMSEYINGIKRAGGSLLSTVNEIIDYSKIETGHLDIIEHEYNLGAIVEDAAGVALERIGGRPITFSVYVDRELPVKLRGDEIRVKDVLIHLLSNAINFTNHGKISLNITGEKESFDKIKLKIQVSDTGNGIKEEEKPFILNTFENNKRAIHENSGAGLGLVIAQSICRIMGGDIRFESVYGEGSDFFATLFQVVVDTSPLVNLENTAGKTLLLYEPVNENALRLERSLKDLGLHVTLAKDAAFFEQKLHEDNFTWTLFPLSIENHVDDVIKSNNLNVQPIVISHKNMRKSSHSFPVLPYPAWIVPIEKTLSSPSGAKNKNAQEWTAPSARILVVDDMITNLKVVKGLLAPYKCEVDLCIKAKQAIDVIEQQDYDIVFMDHLMPDMDGIEAAARIRELDIGYVRNMPIIALTGNAAAGMREMFLENGMNDFLSKPIEVSRLDMIMEKWIPEEKKVKQQNA